IAKERAALGPAEFARERLGIGDYPSDGAGWAVISEDDWAGLADPGSVLPEGGPVAFAADADRAQAHGAIAAAGVRPHGRPASAARGSTAGLARRGYPRGWRSWRGSGCRRRWGARRSGRRRRISRRRSGWAWRWCSRRRGRWRRRAAGCTWRRMRRGGWCTWG